MPWAFTDNGGRFFWETQGEPSCWKSIYYPSRDPEHEIYDLTCMAILLGIISGELPIFTEEFSDWEGVDGEPYDFSRPDAFAPSGKS